MSQLEIDYRSNMLSGDDICKRHNLLQDELYKKVNKYNWKKRNKSEKLITYHLLPYHCLDVAAVGYLLLTPNGRLCQTLASKLKINPELLRNFFVFCLLLHDLGKFSRAFQGLKENLSHDLVKKNSNMPYSERHDSLGFWLWLKVIKPEFSKALPENVQEGIDINTVLRNMDPWLEIVTGHHGIPPKKSVLHIQDYFESDDESAALEFIKTGFDLLLQDFDFQLLLDKNLKKRLKPVSWQLAGISVLADWLGSNQGFFHYQNEQQHLLEYWQDTALKQAETAIKTLPKDPDISDFVTIKELFPFIEQPTPLQDYAIHEPVHSEPQLFILEDVTGAGKTEAALTLIHRLMDKGLADGFYVALPTMATSNAMYDRLAKVYKKFYLKTYVPSLILAHGARELSEIFQKSVFISEQQAIDSSYMDSHDDDEQELSATAYCNAWIADNRKKALLADVGVGTLDQALLGVLPARHQSLRLLGLHRKILLVDEVHAYDSYMQKLLDNLLEAHARQGGSVILLSATLPITMRQNLVNAFNRGLDLSEPVLTSKAYPLVTHTPTESSREIAVDTREEVKRTVTVTRLESEDQAIKMIQETVKSGKCVCWIRNTVKAARKTYTDLLECDWIEKKNLSLFHSRFAMLDRQTIEQKTKNYFDDKSKHEDRKGRILIATQVVEQSLDLDFDVLISDLAPIDLLIQRAGRLRRHIRDIQGNRIREQGAKDQRGAPTLYLLSPEPAKTADADWLKEQQPGTQAVYPHIGQLWLSAKLLIDQKGFTMPQDARDLIEGVYSDEAQSCIPEILLDASKQALGKHMTNISMANLNALKLNKGYTRSSGDWDEEIRIPTRLTEEDTVSVALARLVNGKLRPFANGKRYAWAMSVVKIPNYEWKKARDKIPGACQLLIETLKTDEKALRWLEIFPLIPETETYYNATDGWQPDTGETK